MGYWKKKGGEMIYLKMNVSLPVLVLAKLAEF